jgi:iron(III) transport system ATP-binding protein
MQRIRTRWNPHPRQATTAASAPVAAALGARHVPAGDPAGDGPGGHGRTPVISVEGLTKCYGSKVAVDDVDLRVDAGTFLVLLGPSGSGKSTLLRCLAGIERATAGTVRLGGTVVDGPGVHVPPERRDLAMVFQDYALWPHMTAEANVAFALKRRRLAPDARHSEARRALGRVGLAGLHERYPGQLSGGEQQRVALARALVARPHLLLFDEPLSNLDADRRERLRADIGSMVREQGATAVYITHDQAEAFALADLVGVLRGGRLVQLAAPEDVYREPADLFVARFTGVAGELIGKVLPSPAGEARRPWVSVEVAGQVVIGRPIGAPVPPGARARVLVRPSAVRLDEGGGEPGHGEGDGPVTADPGSRVGAPETWLPAVVREAAFRGWGYEHLVELPGGHRLAGVAHRRRLPVGAAARVVVGADGCLVAEDDQAETPDRGGDAAVLEGTDERTGAGTALAVGAVLGDEVAVDRQAASIWGGAKRPVTVGGRR